MHTRHRGESSGPGGGREPQRAFVEGLLCDLGHECCPLWASDPGDAQVCRCEAVVGDRGSPGGTEGQSPSGSANPCRHLCGDKQVSHSHRSSGQEEPGGALSAALRGGGPHNEVLPWRGCAQAGGQAGKQACVRVCVRARACILRALGEALRRGVDVPEWTLSVCVSGGVWAPHGQHLASAGCAGGGFRQNQTPWTAGSLWLTGKQVSNLPCRQDPCGGKVPSQETLDLNAN